MKIKEKEQDIANLKLYVIDEVCERTIHDTVYRYVVDKNTFEKYFPDWNRNNKEKPKLQPKQKKA
ncbi:hypothetical protein LJC72_05810 [Bacteroides sp. OttesenSCG-928-D19]|nr:hypothetical protein [Bacteroides sp. OttesenSCG-928-N06]MDL2304841.1 hypothetical protein [Bacteroides sp. OttesenSCG-928-D19]